MVNKLIKKVSFFLYLGAFFAVHCGSLKAQNFNKEAFINLLDSYLTPKNGGAARIFSYTESKTIFAKQKELLWHKENTAYSTHNRRPNSPSAYEILYNTIKNSVINPKNAQYITTTMYKHAINLYADLFFNQEKRFYVTIPLRKEEGRNSNIKIMKIDWGEGNDYCEFLSIKLALLTIFKQILQEDIIKKRSQLSWFSIDTIATAGLIRFILPNMTELSRKMSVLKTISYEYENEINNYFKIMQLSKIKDLAEASRHNTFDKNSLFSIESKRNELFKEIKKISQRQEKNKKKGKSISKKVLLISGVIIVVAICLISAVLYLAFYIRKRKKNSNNATSSDDTDEETSDDNEFEESDESEDAEDSELSEE